VNAKVNKLPVESECQSKKTTSRKWMPK